MPVIRRFFQNAGFTAKETSVIASLSLILIIGIIIKYSSCNQARHHDYSAVDENFTQKTKQDFEKLKDRELTGVQKDRAEEIKKYADSLFSIRDSSLADPNAPKPGTMININSAYAADLMILPGIGEITADRIIEYREKNGGFRKTEDIMKVKGIGEKKYAKLKPYISVE